MIRSGKAKRTMVFVCIAVIVMGASGIAVYNRLHVSTIGEPASSDVAKMRAYWADRISTVGPDPAYEEFKRTYGKQSVDQHIYMHIFGSVLVDKKGIMGIATCDDAFNYGCYHGFFARIIPLKGLGVLPQLDDVCMKNHPENQSCQHGIGHGLMEYYGSLNLVKALESCATLRWQEPLFGCQDGVFMEYNFPVIIQDQGRLRFDTRIVDTSHPYAPCPSVPGRFRQACYYALGQWWQKVFEHDYKHMGRLCLAVLSPEEQAACFRGIGNVIPPTDDYDVEKTIHDCMYMPTDKGQETCLLEATSGFLASHAASRAAEVCDGIAQGAKTTCLSRAHSN